MPPRNPGRSSSSSNGCSSPAVGQRCHPRSSGADFSSSSSSSSSSPRKGLKKVASEASFLDDHLTRASDSDVVSSEACWITRGQVRAVRHKLCFLLTFVDGLVAAFWIGRQPQTFWINYTVKMVLLLGLRYITWKPIRQHYYMFDFCYFANAVTLTYVFLLPQNAMLFNAASGFCGFMLLSSQLFRDSLVLHSVDFFTTMQLHLMPSLTMWTIRWYEYDETSAFFQYWAPYILKPTKEISVWPAIRLYLTWATLYSLLMFVVARHKIERLEYKNLYQYVMVKVGLRNKFSPYLPCLRRYPYGEIAFMSVHCFLFLSSLVYAKLGYYAQSIILSLAVLKDIYNGGAYYIDHFWKCYDQNAAWYLATARVLPGDDDADLGRGKTSDSPVDVQARSVRANPQDPLSRCANNALEFFK